MAKVILIFGSTGGNTELTADKVAAVLTENGHAVTVRRAEHAHAEDLDAHDAAVLACPTYGHGVLQDDFIPFYEAFRKHPLKGKPCAVIGLGDPRYELQYHTESAVTLEEAVKEAGGTMAIPALRISRSPVPFLNTLIADWAKKLAAIL